MNRCCRRWRAACAALVAASAVLGWLATGEARKAAQAEELASAVQWEAQAWAQRIGVDP